MSTYDYEPDPKYYGPEPRHISHGFRKVGREGMTYQLPEPHFIWQNPDKGYYTAAQMQAAWQAGRDSMKAECVKVCEGMKTVSGVDDCERGFNAALRRSAESIKELK